MGIRSLLDFIFAQIRFDNIGVGAHLRWRPVGDFPPVIENDDVVLLEQLFVFDNKTRIGKVVDQAAKQAGAPVRIAGYLRLELGDGIEKKSEDFAAEVAAQLKK